MRRIAICDDSDVDAWALEKALSGLRAKGIPFETELFSSGASLLSAYAAGERFDLVLLDMLMEPMGGIECASHLRTFDAVVPIVAVTSTTEYALDGYKVGARRYLVKPVDADELVWEVAQALRSATAVGSKLVRLTPGQTSSYIRAADVTYFEARLHASLAHTVDATWQVPVSISELEREYGQDGFFRCHKSLLVSLAHVLSYGSGHVRVTGGDYLDVSRRRAAAFEDAMLAWAVDFGAPPMRPFAS